MTTEQLRASFLQAAIQGRLVPQDPADGNAADLLAAIRAERERLIKEKKLRKSKPLPPIDPDEIPFQIPDSWQWVRIGELFQIINGRAFKPEEWTAKGLPIVRIQNLRDPSAFYNHYDGKIEDCYLLNGNELLFSWSGTPGTSFGAFIWKGGKAILNQHIFKMLPYGIDTLNIEFAEKALQAELDFFVKKAHGGVGLRHITLKEFAFCLFPLPPLAEQERIVAKLNDCLAWCEACSERDRLDLDFGASMRKSLLQTAIRGELLPQDPADGNAADLLAAIRTERERLIKEKKLRKPKPLPPIDPDEIPFQIPDSWQWVRLGEVVRLKMGKTPARAEPEWWGAGIPWVSISDMPDGGHVQKTRESISKAALTSVFKDHVSPVGTLLMSFKLTIGKVAILDIPAVHNEAIVSIEPFEAAPIRDFLYFVLPFLVQFGERKRAIKGDTLNGESLSRLLIPLPPLAEQERIVAKLGELLPLCTPSA